MELEVSSGTKLKAAIANEAVDQAFLLGHRVALLHGGTLAALGRPQDVLTPAALRLLYGVDVAISRVDDAHFGERAVCVPRIEAGGRRAGGE